MNKQLLCKLNTCICILQIECVDEVESNLLRSMLDFIFKKCCAIAMIHQIEQLIMEKCNGCAINHPSQLEHSCLTETNEQC